jgi:hypothetical protein
MMRNAARIRNAVIVGTFITGNPAAVHADSDGYYCVGPGYVAYQFGFAAPPVAAHRLYVAAFSVLGLAEVAVVELPQFQVHAMRCGESAVDLASHDSYYSVVLGPGDRRPVSVTRRARVGAVPSWTGETRNLSHYSRAARTLENERYLLVGDGAGRQVVLEISAVPHEKRECPPAVVARLVRYGADGVEAEARVLPRGRDEPECAGLQIGAVRTGNTDSEAALDNLLDAVVFGARGPTDTSGLPIDVQNLFEEYLRRSATYRTSRPAVGGGEMMMVDAARVSYERRLVAAGGLSPSAAVNYVDDLRPCYEWEGMHDCPEREAVFADSIRSGLQGAAAEYLTLLAAHRWLCAAEGREYERQPGEASAARSRFRDRVLTAGRAESALIRYAAERLAERGECFRRRGR